MALKTIPLTEAHAAQLAERGISAEQAQRLGWLTCVERKGDWIAIPFLRAGKVVNHKYRRIRKLDKVTNFEQDKGGEQCFYNLEALEAINRLSPDEQRAVNIVITEGELDCAAALQAGYLAVSVPSGAPAEMSDGEDSAKFDFLKDFPKYAIAVIAADDDAPGHILRKEIALRIGWHRCKWVQYPKACKDLGDVAEKYGDAGIRKVLNDKAAFMNAGGLFRMSELPAIPDLPAYACGIGNLDQMVKPRFGDLVVVSGIPSFGKTTFVTALCCNLVNDYALKPCFGSFEQSPRMDHLRNLRTWYLAKPQKDQFGNHQWKDSEIALADAWIDKNFSFIVPDVNTDELVTLKWVLARVRAAITQYGANVIVIDPWNELDHDRPNGMSLTEYTGYAIKEFKRIAKQYMVMVIIVAHPAKLEKNRDGGYDIPNLYDISDSSHWANKCDIGIIVHRLEGETSGKYATLVRVAKVRYWGIIGRTGDRLFEFIPETNRYIDAPDFQQKRKKQNDRPLLEKQDKKSPKDAAQQTLGIENEK